MGDLTKTLVRIVGNYKKAAILENEFEAQLLESILLERNIPHRLRSYHDTAFDGLFQTQKGWGCISGPEEHLEEIKEVISDLRKRDADPLT